MNNKEIALNFIKNGIPVFPCSPPFEQGKNPGKNPLISNGFKGASTDVGIVEGWWDKWPSANIGMPTGDKTYHVLDVDIKKEKNGLETLIKLEKKYGELPRTTRAATGSGGIHIYFIANDPLITISTDKIGNGLDFRGNGGYVILPGSTHENGKKYVWLRDHSPGDTSVAPLPGWIANLAKSEVGGKKKTGSPTEDSFAGDRNSGRNDYLFRKACALRHTGCTEETILAAVEAMNEKFEDPLPTKEIQTIVSQASKYPPGNVPVNKRYSGRKQQVVNNDVVPKASINGMSAKNFAAAIGKTEKCIRLWIKEGLLKNVKTEKIPNGKFKYLIYDNPVDFRGGKIHQKSTKYQNSDGNNGNIEKTNGNLDGNFHQPDGNPPESDGNFHQADGKNDDSDGNSNGNSGDGDGNYDGSAPASILDIGREFFVKRSFIPVILSNVLMEEFHYFNTDPGGLHIYKDGWYQKNGKQHINLHSRIRLANNARTNRVSEVIDHIKAITFRDLDSADELYNPRQTRGYVNFKNCMYNFLKPGQFPHDPRYMSTLRIPVVYDPAARCPKIENFLKTVLPEDCIELFYEMLGVCLVPTAKYEKAFMFVGGAARGKSTTLNIIEKFIGELNISNVPLSDLDEKQFAPVGLVGKLINFCADISGSTLMSTVKFQSVVSGDRMRVEYKREDAFEFHPFCKLIFSANSIPATVSGGYPFLRRWIFIPFPHHFDEAKREPGIARKLISPEEFSGLLNHALCGLARVIKNEKFTENATTKEVMDQYKIETNNVAAFINECCIQDQSIRVKTTELFEAYLKFCETSKIRRILQKQKFYREVEKLMRDRIICGGVDYFPGLALRSVDSLEMIKKYSSEEGARAALDDYNKSKS